MNVTIPAAHDHKLNGLRAVVAKTAIVIGVLGIVFYAGFVTGSTGLPTFDHPDSVAPPLSWSSAFFQDNTTAQEAWSYFPDNYVTQGKNEDGNVMTYEHD